MISGVVIAFLMWLPVLATADNSTQDIAKLSKADYDRAIADPENDDTFRQLLDKLPKITAGEPPGRTYYVLEGDLLLTKSQIRDTFRRYRNEPRPVAPTGELKAMAQNGNLVFWPVGHRHLTYVIDSLSFTPSERETIAANLRAAARSWEDACADCDLRFTEVAVGGSEPTFRVVKTSDLGGLVALSFFPNDPTDMRLLRIAPVYFQLGPGNFNPVGVLRHELGHVLGYRHEQIDNVPGCVNEDGNWRTLTVYDPKSVMHYFCGGAGTKALDLTTCDQMGHREFYRGHINEVSNRRRGMASPGDDALQCPGVGSSRHGAVQSAWSSAFF